MISGVMFLFSCGFVIRVLFLMFLNRLRGLDSSSTARLVGQFNLFIFEDGDG